MTEAAKMLGVPRKSLDDYLLMLKHAKANNFNFKAHSKDKFGIVRSFVKKVKSNSKTLAGRHEDAMINEDGAEDLSQSSNDSKLSQSSKKITKAN